jgi:putative endopeptidase
MRKSLVVLAGLVLASCSGTKPATVAAPPPPAPKTEYGTWGVDLAARDLSVKPGDDFFMYANGSWYKTAVIPADRSSTGSFQNLRITSEKRMIDIAASLDAKPADQLTPEEKKLRDLYDAFNDQAQIEANGLKPVQHDLDRLAGLKTKADVAAAMADPRLGAYSIYGIGVGIDTKNSSKYSVNLSQGGIGLPNRDYYLKSDPELVKTQDAYRKHLAAMFALAGIGDGDARAARIYDFEHKLAADMWANEDARDTDKTYNPMSYSQLKKLEPQFPWNTFFAASRIPTKAPKGERQVIVAEKSAFPKIAKLFAETPVSTLRDYLTVHYLDSYAAYLPKKFDDESFAFYGTVIQGNAQQLPRAARAAHLLDGDMGEALGKLYVAKYFPPESKAKAQELIGNLLKAYDADIRTLDWMTDATRQKALEKLHKFTVKVGYPDHWRDYSKLVIDRNDLIGSVQNAAEFEWNRNLVRLDDPVDKSEWGMSPPTVNAYNNFQWNEIVFPAAIMQPPFFDPNADDAVNYGGIGAVIGHEISHGFDDQGSKYGPDGSLSNWWTPEDRAKFEARTKALGAQYNAYEPLPGLHVNGANTMGENIADNAGIAIALKAYHISLGGKPAPVIDGLTGDQRFYLSFGQIWRSKMREGALRAQTMSNEHSPPQFRAIGATRNQDEWYASFGAKPGEKYYLAPDQRVHFW